MTAAAGTEGLRYRSPTGRWVLLATVLGSGIAFLDSTVVNVALPTIGEDLDAGISSLQWVVNAYTLTLAGFLLLGGSLGDHYGRRKVFVIGVVWFAAASLLCGLAPTDEALIAARALQGVGGALLTPGSLAIIEASFRREDRGAAIGAWSGLGGVTAAVGPFLGGWLVQAASWRLIFLINLPLAAVVVWVSLRHVPESRDPGATGRLDWPGAALAAVGLAGVVYALTDGPEKGWTTPLILASALVGVGSLVAFLLWERRTPAPMLPLDIFASRQFSAANAVTFAVYGALGGSLFLLPIQLQRVVGYSPLASGVALVPITVVMLLLSARAGRLASRIGPRLPMTLGPLLVGAGLALLTRVGPGASYLVDILPATLVYGFGLVLTVAPLTSTVLAAAPAEHAGIASAVNNDVARTAGLLAVAVLPVAAGISGADALEPARFDAGFQTAMTIAAVLCAAGGVLSWLTIRNPEPEPEREPADPPLSCPLSAPSPVSRRA
ncbi:MAG TPA: MFS transporter [Actinomycetes bacterium]|nr:MFS transporter [Actinomycetes bacterium]